MCSTANQLLPWRLHLKYLSNCGQSGRLGSNQPRIGKVLRSEILVSVPLLDSETFETPSESMQLFFPREESHQPRPKPKRLQLKRAWQENGSVCDRTFQCCRGVPSIPGRKVSRVKPSGKFDEVNYPKKGDLLSRRGSAASAGARFHLSPSWKTNIYIKFSLQLQTGIS